jgi:hypothetical protein
VLASASATVSVENQGADTTAPTRTAASRAARSALVRRRSPTGGSPGRAPTAPGSRS